jgi:hypothetical protein
MADAQQAVTAWDEQGNPIKPPASGGAAAWDEHGNPIHAGATPAPNPRTGEGMENYALQQAGSMFTPNRVTGQTAQGQPTYDKPPNIIDKAYDESTARQVRLGAAENRASHAPTPFTNASSLFAPVTAAKQIIGAKVGSRVGEQIDPTYGPLVGGALGGGIASISPRGTAQRVLRGPGGTGDVSINPVSMATRELEATVPRNEPPGARQEMQMDVGQQQADAIKRVPPELGTPENPGLNSPIPTGRGSMPKTPVSKVSASPGPYRGPSSVNPPSEVPVSSSITPPPSIAPGPTVPPGGLPSESGPSLFDPGAGGPRTPGRVGNEGSAARFTNESAYAKAKQGSREAIMTLGRRGIEPPPNSRYIMGDVDTDRVVYNPRETTRFGPTGEAIRDMDVPEKGSRSVIAAPGGVQGTPVAVGPQRFNGGQEQRSTPGVSPTGVERRGQAVQDYQDAISNTPPGVPTPGEKMAHDIHVAQAGKPSGISEGEALQWIMKDADTYAKYKAADSKAQGQMLVRAKNELLKMK